MTSVALRSVFAVSTLLVTLTGCGPRGNSRVADGTGKQPPIRVTAIRPERKTLVRTIELPGHVEAFEVAPLHSKVTGFVVKIPVNIGDEIRGPKGDEPGAALCELLVPELREELAEKTASVAQTEAEVLQSDAAVKVAEAAERSADALVREARSAVAREEARFARWQSEF